MAVVGLLGGSTRKRGLGWAKAHSARSSLVAGDIEGILELQQIPQVEVMVEVFVRALGWAWSTPMLAWCLNKAPCTLCAWWEEACKFDGPSMGFYHDTSVCLLCCARPASLTGPPWAPAMISLSAFLAV
ncbi:hypothetical protein H2248_004183 [Termitomyces sp. 'cryptogamus']|nr:hypothetical protein H2248_004183 [Termitomyces sp. 'cryptogamus']